MLVNIVLSWLESETSVLKFFCHLWLHDGFYTTLK